MSHMDASETLAQRHAEAMDADSHGRLATLGALASNISHDLNNLIMTIQGSAEMGLRELHNVAKLTQGLETILIASRHSKDLIEQIRAFKRSEEGSKVSVDFNGLLHESYRLLQVRAPDSITLNFVIPNDNIFVICNESQIQQVLMNLYKRAIQAMQESGGTLLVTLDAVDKNGGAPHARLRVEDTGTAIHQEMRDTIFDPMSTSASIGIGTSLGLALCKDIITQHDGSIALLSEPGEHTVFEITLPTTLEIPPASAAEASMRLAPSHQKKNILLVDDEPFMRGLGMDMLHSLGYRVTVAADGKEALDLVLKSPDYFDIILSDSKMPEMTGPELAEKLHELNLGLPFVLVSAFTDDATAERLKIIGVNDIVKKPFLVSSLAKALTKALAEQKG